MKILSIKLLLLITILLLILSLFTPEGVKTHNYILWLENKPQIVNLPVIIKYPCPLNEINPEYNKEISYINELCEERHPMGYDFIFCDFGKTIESPRNTPEVQKRCEPYLACIEEQKSGIKIKKWLEKTCEKTIGTEKWFSIFDKKLFKL